MEIICPKCCKINRLLSDNQKERYLNFEKVSASNIYMNRLDAYDESGGFRSSRNWYLIKQDGVPIGERFHKIAVFKNIDLKKLTKINT